MLYSYKVERLKISAYKKDTRTDSPEEFEFPINPETITNNYKNKFGRSRGINTSGRTSLYALSAPEEMSLQLTFDSTLSYKYIIGKSAGSSLTVVKQVDNFINACHFMDGDIHQPRFLLLEWGELSFKCRLKSVKVNYTHFNAKGEALRAKLDTVFVADMTESERIRLENKKSPDITHQKLVLQGQTITGISKDIYGDASYYLDVATANQLDHFRQLQPGKKLQFSPINK